MYIDGLEYYITNILKKQKKDCKKKEILVCFVKDNKIWMYVPLLKHIHSNITWLTTACIQMHVTNWL